ncbi:MAG: haloalkane dehalogenase [Candidatus Azotimanducaceae bacterium]|jgi:haloalkane dehalogenase
MTDYTRTPNINFSDLDDFPYDPHYHQWHDLRMHYIDEGPEDGPVMLLLHGMPTWSYLYRHMIPLLTAAGYRCIAPDHMGFGRSDKPNDIHWYSIARHTEILTSLIVTLDLQDITLVCQDWGGPLGLAQAALMPERFSRLTIMNTWLHHDEYEYSEAIRNWNQNWHEDGLFCREKPDVGILLLMSAGLIGMEVFLQTLIKNENPKLSGEANKMYRGFSAPYKGLEDAAFNGYRRFPLSIPFDDYLGGNGPGQSSHYQMLLNWQKPVHFIWGCSDDVFNEDWGRKWSGQMNASFDAIPAAGHFLQNTHGPDVVDFLLKRISAE